MAQIPKVIQFALDRLHTLVTTQKFLHGRKNGLKAMRSDRAENTLAVLEVMLRDCTMQFNGAICAVDGNAARALTVPEIARYSKVKQRTVERIIHDLKDMGLLQSEKQFKRVLNGNLTVSAVWRVFTKLFWDMLGLWSLFVESVKYACTHKRLVQKFPLKKVGKKIGNIFQRCLKLTNEQKKEQERQSARNNQMFQDMCSCVKFKNRKVCRGGRMSEEICALCHRLHQ